MTSNKTEDKYKRYLLFAYKGYYPSGGQDDVLDSFETIDDARKRIADSQKNYEYEYFDLLDLQERIWVDL